MNIDEREKRIRRALEKREVPQVLPYWASAMIAAMEDSNKVRRASRARVRPKGVGPGVDAEYAY